MPVAHRLVTALAGLTILSLLLAACGGGDDAPPPATAPTQPTATTAPAPTTAAPQATATARPAPTAAPTAGPTATPAPQSRGELIITLDNLGSFNLVGGLVDTSTSKPYLDAMYDYFIGAADDGKLDPNAGFVNSWTLSADGTVFTFKNRSGVLFHNGDTASSSDVKFNFDRMMAEGSRATQAANLRREVKSIAVPDSSTTVFTLNSRNIFWHLSFMSRLGSATASQHLIPQRYITTIGEESANRRPVGSGPYKFVSATVGNEVSMAAVATHWLYGTPRVKSLVVANVPEESTRIALIKTGASDLAPVSKRQAAPLQREATLKLFQRADAGVGTYRTEAHFAAEIPGYGKNPFADVRVRRAVDTAIDRKALVDGFLSGYGKPATGVPGVGPQRPGVHPSDRPCI